MNSNQENFEQLESFIDGELDAAGRAQMEAQIGANPKLRKMVAELAATRVLVASLPRVPAPADLMETFQGRMERAVLLGDSGMDESDGSMRISRWPQVMSIAAILLLSLGLAGVIYKILPQRKSNAQLASNTTAAGGPSGSLPGVPPDTKKLTADEMKSPRSEVATGVRGGLDATELQKRDDASIALKNHGDNVAENEAMKFKAAGDASANKPAVPGAPDPAARILALKKDGNGPVDVNNDHDRVAVDDLLLAQKALNDAAKILDGKAVAKGSEREPMMVRVLAESPERANQDVTDFLVSNHIAYAAIETPNQYGLFSGNLAVGNSTNTNNSTANNSTVNIGTANNSTVSNAGNLASNNTANTVEPARRANADHGDIDNGAAAGASGGRFAAASGGPPAAARGGGGGGRGGAGGGGGGGFGGGAAPGALAQSQASAVNFDNRSATQEAMNDKQQAFNQNGYSQTQPSSAESLGQNGFQYNNQYNGGNFANANGGLNLRNNSVANGAYRARLTDRQLKDLNTRIASRGNQWVEEVLVTEAADQNPAASAAPSSPATRPVSAASAMEPASAPTTRASQTMSRSIVEDAKDASRVAPALPAAPASQSSFAKQEQLTLGVAENAREKFADEPSRDVVIVVNEQPINLPITLPPSTQPAAGQTVAPSPRPATDTDTAPRESNK